MAFRLGVDVGGTFTDLLLINDESGQTWTAKIPSTPDDSSRGVLNGVQRICETSGVDPQLIEWVMHGTTVATNAVLTGRGARVGLVTTSGFKDVLQVARSFCPGGLGGWVSYVKKPLLAPLELTIEAEERVGGKGEIVRELDVDTLRVDLRRLHAKGEVEALTICLFNAYLNPLNEQLAKQVAQEIFVGIPVSISSDVIPEMQEYERTETTVVNSYVRPEVENYINNLQRQLTEKMKDVRLSILRSDGGLTSVTGAAESPVNLLLSGPAGGVAGATYFCSKGGFDDILTFDMGGTSTDVALIQNGRARIRRETRVGDVVVRAPSVDVRTVGAGGGSIAFVPELTRALRVGPQSAGAEPGPAAYCKGGTEPTVTDANVVLGYLPSDVKLGGEMQIDKSRSVAVVQNIADAMGISLMDAAEGIVRIVNESMFGALRLVSVEQGFDPREFALVGFGGAGPLHANALGQLLNSWPVIVPPSPGVLCAYGDISTQVQNEASRSFVRALSELKVDEILQELGSLRARAAEPLNRDGIPEAEQEVVYQADVRYAGQAFQLSLDFNEQSLKQKGIAALVEEFDREHVQLFTFSLEEGHELVMLRAVVRAKSGTIPLLRAGESSGDLSQARIQDSEIWYQGQSHPTIIYDRDKLGAGQCVDGPAIIVEMDSTTVVLPDFTATVDTIGNLLINPAESV
ncbi:MAG: hydantoinase/oxoprolinase family protein [Porticoccaceae bacterium]